jgi:hypothetical protein
MTTGILVAGGNTATKGQPREKVVAFSALRLVEQGRLGKIELLLN